MALLATPPIPLEKRAQVEQVAAAHKVAPVTCAPIVIQWVPRSSLEADHPGLSGVAGQAFLAECRIQVSFGLGTATACAILVHELGHLGGLGHSENPRSVMAPMLRVIPPYCFVPVSPTLAGLRRQVRADGWERKLRNCRTLELKLKTSTRPVIYCTKFRAMYTHLTFSWAWYVLN